MIISMIAFSGCEQKAVEIKSEKAQQEDVVADSKETATKSSNSNKELSEDIYTFQLSVNGKVMQFPMTYSKFIKYGWEYKGSEDATIFAEDEMLSEWFQSGDDQILTYLSNFNKKSMVVPDSYVTGIIVDQNYVKNEKTEILLPANIQIGIATIEDVEEAYGDPTSSSESGAFQTLTYELDTNQFVSLGFDAENVLTEIMLRNSIIPDDFEISEEDDQSLQKARDYETPLEMSENLFDYTVTFDGALYQTPAPVHAFMEDGWKLVESESDRLVESKKTGKVTLTKNGQTFWTQVSNLGDDTDEIRNCFVTNLVANVKDCDVDMEIAGGIQMGMTQEDLEKAMEPYEYEKQISSYIYYQLNDPDQEDCGYEIIVRDGIVTGIEMQKTPNE